MRFRRLMARDARHGEREAQDGLGGEGRGREKRVLLRFPPAASGTAGLDAAVGACPSVRADCRPCHATQSRFSPPHGAFSSVPIGIQLVFRKSVSDCNAGNDACMQRGSRPLFPRPFFAAVPPLWPPQSAPAPARRLATAACTCTATRAASQPRWGGGKGRASGAPRTGDATRHHAMPLRLSFSLFPSLANTFPAWTPSLALVPSTPFLPRRPVQARTAPHPTDCELAGCRAAITAGEASRSAPADSASCLFSSARPRKSQGK